MKIRIMTLAIVLISLIFAIPAKSLEVPGPNANSGKVKYLKLIGTITDYDGTPIEGAIVRIEGLDKFARTNSVGVFEIYGIISGIYRIVVIADGYMDYSTEPFMLNMISKTFKIRLLKKVTEEIVVTATQTPKIYAEVAVKTEVITRKEIDQKHANTLADSLSLTTGIRVENNCQNCNFTQVRINGLDGKYSQVLIDSAPVFSTMVGVYGLEQIPAEMLNRIEVIKGGGSVLYGGNAIAGVINVLTKEPQTNSATIRYHQEFARSEPFTDIGFRSSIVSKDNHTKAFLFATHKRREPVYVDDDEFSELGMLNNTSFGINFIQDLPGANAKLKIGFFRITEERRGGNKFDQPVHEADVAEWIKSDLIGLSSSWTHHISTRLFYNVGASVALAKRDTYYGAGQDPNAYGNTDNPVVFLSGQMNYIIGSHLLSLGVQLKEENLEDRAIAYDRIIDEKYKETGIFLQDDFNISKNISVLAGIRVSDHSLVEDLIINPRVSLLWNIVRNISWRTTYSTGYRAPQVFDEDLHITQVGGEGMLIINSPDLKEENSWGLSTGFDYGVEIGKNVLQLSLEGFYTKLSDTFILHEVEEGSVENTLVLKRINGSDSEIYGVALDFGLKVGQSFSIGAGWTFQKSELEEPEPDFNSTDFFRTPDSYGYVSLSYENDVLPSIDLSMEYTGKMKVPHFAGYIKEDRLETTDPFFVVNAKIHKHFNFTPGNTVTVFIGIFNILDSFQGDLDQGEFRDAGYVYGPSKPRSYYAGFELTF